MLAPEDAVAESRDFGELGFCSQLEQTHRDAGSGWKRQPRRDEGAGDHKRRTLSSLQCAGRPHLKVTQHRQNELCFSPLRSVPLSAPRRDGLVSLRDVTSQIPLLFTCPPMSELTPVLAAGASPLLCIQACTFIVCSRHPYSSSRIGVCSIAVAHLPLCSVLLQSLFCGPSALPAPLPAEAFSSANIANLSVS